MTNLRFIFDLFDEGGSAEASATSQSGIGEDAKAFLRTLGESEEGISELDQVGAPGAQVSDQSADNSEQPETFADLVAKGGKYHKEFGEAISSAIKDRFKNQPDYKSTIAGYDEALAPLYEKYGLEAGDVEGLSKSIAEDDSNYADKAEKMGLTIEQYKHNLQLEKEAARGREITQAYEAEKARNEMYATWESDAETLRESFPAFDLGMELKSNERFGNLLDNGVSVTDAFFATHAAEILSGMNAESNADAKRSVVDNINQRAARPPENGARHNPAVQKKLDPRQFTGEDVDKILKAVQNGATFTF